MRLPNSRIIFKTSKSECWDKIVISMYWLFLVVSMKFIVMPFTWFNDYLVIIWSGSFYYCCYLSISCNDITWSISVYMVVSSQWSIRTNFCSDWWCWIVDLCVTINILNLTINVYTGGEKLPYLCHMGHQFYHMTRHIW